MAIVKGTKDGWVWLVGADDSNNAYPVGPAYSEDKNATMGQVWEVNGTWGLNKKTLNCKHHVGLYMPTPSTATLRVYFEDGRQEAGKGKDTLPDLGYIQFAALRWNGTAIPPDIVPGFASRRWYAPGGPATSSSSSSSFNIFAPIPPAPYTPFLEFMGPHDANVRFRGSEFEAPFHAMNAAASNAIERWEDFGEQGMPCGAMRWGDDNPWANAINGKKRATAASLRLSIRPFLPREQALAAYCNDKDNPPLIEVTVSISKLAGTTYETVMALLGEAEYGATGADVIDIQAIGGYLLITLNDDWGIVLIARISNPKRDSNQSNSSSSQPQWVVTFEVWECSEDEYSGLEQDAVYETIDSIGEWFNNTMRRLPIDFSGVLAKAKGSGGLRRPHALVWDSFGDPALQIDLHSIVYSRKVTKKGQDSSVNTTALSGVTTTLEWRYERSTGQLRFGWNNPSLCTDFGVFNGVLQQYKKSLDNPPQEDGVAASNFLLAGAWADPAVPGAG
jgi:hypothetical protein